mgnify:FL=1|tara:strand:+ start:1780 stop:2019 length:240 start_codon:yes stop_codon:yes gene_type:complete
MTDQIILILCSVAFGYGLGFIIRYYLDEKQEKINTIERSDFDDGIKYNNEGGKTLQEMVDSKNDPENYFAGLGRNYHNE